MLLCKIILDGCFGEVWLFELILESVVRFSSRPNGQSVSCTQQGIWKTLCRLTPISDWYRLIPEVVWDSLTLFLLSSSLLFSPQNSSLKGESLFLVVCGVRANFSCDILDKQYLEWIENHHFTYCSIYHNCKTITKTLVHDPCSSTFITHVAVGQILSSARFGIFHCRIVLFVKREARIVLVLALYVHRRMYVEFWMKKK